MRAASNFYRQSDPNENRQFRRLWSEPARALRITPPPAVVRTLDHVALDIVTAWRADAGRM